MQSEELKKTILLFLMGLSVGNLFGIVAVAFNNLPEKDPFSPLQVCRVICGVQLGTLAGITFGLVLVLMNGIRLCYRRRSTENEDGGVTDRLLRGENLGRSDDSLLEAGTLLARWHRF